MDRRQPAAGRMAGVYFNSDRRIPSFGVPRADRRGRYQAFGRSCALDIRKNIGFAAHNSLRRRRTCTFISLPEFGQNPQDDRNSLWRRRQSVTPFDAYSHGLEMKIKFLVGVVIVALAVAAGIMLLPTKAVQKEAAAPVVSENKAQVSVARAAANLSPGSFLSARDIEWTAVAQSAAKGAFVQNESQDLSGALVLKPIKAGEVISPSALLARTDPEFVAAVLAPGMRAFTIEVILAAQTDPQKSRAFASQKNFDVARTLLHNLRVIAVDHTIEPKGFGADPQSSDPRMVRSSTPANINRKGTVTLEVTPKDVELLTVARSNGQLSLSLRNSQSSEAVQTGLPEKELTKLAEIIPSRSDKTPQAAVKVKTFYGSSTEPPQQ